MLLSDFPKRYHMAEGSRALPVFPTAPLPGLELIFSTSQSSVLCHCVIFSKTFLLNLCFFSITDITLVHMQCAYPFRLLPTLDCSVYLVHTGLLLSVGKFLHTFLELKC